MMGRLELLLNHHSLSSLLEQNDVEELTVLEWMYEEGLIDLADYFYQDMEEHILEEEE